ncbi:MAG TPA: radical SAM protein [Candidatus Hydrogenedentes bacterium]|nr:radical SAM protein [Candidatus Hydrogenedentota bacterium]
MRRLRLLLVHVGRRTIELPVITPPLGILSLAAYLRDRLPLDIRLIDQRLENAASGDIVRAAIDLGADVVGLGTLTPMAHLLPGLTQQIRKALPDALIVLGGPHVAAFGASVLEDTEADAAVPGEGEIALEQILRAYAEGGGFGHIPGLIWRDPSGEIIVNPGAIPHIEELDSLPFPAYDLIDFRKYWRFETMVNMPPRRYAGFFSSRGCPYRCIYCHCIFGKHFRAQSPERIVAEIEHWQSLYGMKVVEFYDDTFNYDAGRVMEFCQLALKRNLGLKIAFPNAIRGDILTREIVDALADAGLYYTACALETATPRLQKYIGKHLNVPRFLEGVDLLARRRVFTYGFTMLGFPTETEEELRNTIDTTCDSMLHATSFFTVTPFPGTELYARVLETHSEKLQNVDYRGKSYSNIMVNLSELPDAIFYGYQRMALRKFYLNPGRLFRIVRSYPHPWYLPHYVPVLAMRLGRGLLA